MRVISAPALVVALLTLISCGGGNPPTPTGPTTPPRPSSGLTFTTPNLGGVSAGQPSMYSFCRPPISGNDLCSASATNPTGGTPPYTFQLGIAGGFPPIGMSLNLNGTLTGTPSAAGVSNFVVCAVDLVRDVACDTVRFTVDAAGPAPPPPAPPPTTPASYDGAWNVTVAVSSCYSFRHTVPVTVTGGNFSGTLFAYCAVATNGATRLDTGSGCGSDIRQTVSAAGRMANRSVDGNLTLSGGACNGSNGFSGSMPSTTAGSAASFWGQLTFAR